MRARLWPLPLLLAAPLFALDTAGKPPLHDRALVADLHCDTLYQLVTRKYSIAPGEKPPPGYAPEVTVDSMRKGGYDAQVFAIWVPDEAISDPTAYTARALAAYREMLAAAKDLAPARTADELYLANERGKIAALLSVEGAEAIGTRADDLRPLADAGLSMLGLSWNRPNAFSDAAQAKEKPHGGLSAEGERLVDLAGDLGVLVDISHASDEAFWDVIKRTRRPVVASHSSARAVFDHPRNLDDEQLLALRATGGVVGVNFHAKFLTGGAASRDDVVAHIAHMIEVGGPALVALGSDFDGMIKTPEGLRDAAAMPSLTEALLARGVSPDDVELLLGRSFVRALAKASGAPPLPGGEIPVPLEVKAIKASSEERGAEARRAADRSRRTAWRAAAKDPAPAIELSGDGPAPKSLALRGPVGGPLRVAVTVEAGGAKVERALLVPEDGGGVGLILPGLSAGPWRLRVAAEPRAEVGLAEVVAYDK